MARPRNRDDYSLVQTGLTASQPFLPELPASPGQPSLSELIPAGTAITRSGSGTAVLGDIEIQTPIRRRADSPV